MNETFLTHEPRGNIHHGGRSDDPDEFGFRRILAPTDFSAPSLKALDYALDLAGHGRAEVCLLHVLEPKGECINYLNCDAGLPMLPLGDEEARCRQELDAVVRRWQPSEGTITRQLWMGDAVTGIVDTARMFRADLIVISTHGRTGLKHILLGSVVERVLREAPCPILVLHKHEREFCRLPSGVPGAPVPRRILVPIDLSFRSRLLLHYAAGFAKAFGGEITLVHCLNELHGCLGSEFPSGAAAEEESVARRIVERWLRDCVPGDVSGNVVLRSGRPEVEIPTMAEEGAFDLIICTNRVGVPLRHALLGSTAEGIVRRAGCPVLVARGGAISGA